MHLDVPSKKEFDALSNQVSEGKSDIALLEREVAELRETVDLLIEMLKTHLSPIDIRKLRRR